MLVVGASLARAVGIAGAATLIRSRAKIDERKDEGEKLEKDQGDKNRDKTLN